MTWTNIIVARRSLTQAQGVALSRKTVTKQQISEAIRMLAHEPAYLERAQQLAEENKVLLKTSAISALADLAESIA